MEHTQPKNVFTYCLRCGAPEFKQHSDNSFRCDACDFEYFLNAAGAVAGLIEDADGRLLLTQRAHNPMKGTLDLPGGFVNLMESAEDALAREIKEELNLEITHLSFFGSFPNQYPFGGLTYFTLDLVFRCTALTFDTIHPSDDVADYVFYAPKEIDIQHIGLDSIKRVIRTYQKSTGV